ncbi:MAG: SDR family oxidoreductase [Alphaproteobacteria bacterium]|jgi:NAD(P)-dependent dehydrogenase (short-subunit alcohol dehydrogenase family)|nr:SDR family oxidoreductase [Alphaproteobacteria bacterium]
MESLQGRRVIVVGAGSGMGKATAGLAAQAGARVHLVSRSPAALEEAAGRIGGSATWAVADMARPGAMVQATAVMDQVDHMLISAVSGELERKVDIGSATEDQLERSFDRLRGYVRTVQAVLPKMPSDGSITLWCGASAIRPPRRGFALLAAENASVGGFARALALELAPIRVNTLMAGVIDTAIHVHHREEVRNWAERALPVARFGQAEDIAHAALFLMTNPYLTGQVVTVDGGFSLI